VRKFIIFFIPLIFLTSCHIPDTFGFYQPILLDMKVPEGPAEYQAGWHAGCTSALAAKSAFANSWVYNEGIPDFGNGVYQHDSNFRSGWGQAFFACKLRISEFVNFNSMAAGPLE
jgi:hypothetical protein